MKFLISLISFLLLFSAHAADKIKVVATTSDVAALVRVVAGDRAEVIAIAKGTQDPHYIEAKPSYMVNLRDAQLLVANGLSLEEGWLPSLIRGARNPKVQPGQPGYLDLGASAEAIEIPQGPLSRSQGDVHPDGNPHFTLDPVRMGRLGLVVAKKLGELDTENKDFYHMNALAYQKKLEQKVSEWQSRLKKSQVTKLITYHPSLNYFLERFKIASPVYIENKPGVPPSGQHILSVIQLMKDQKLKIILVDNFFDTKIADRIAKEVPGAKVRSVGVAVGSASELKTLEDLIEQLVRTIEGA